MLSKSSDKVNMPPLLLYASVSSHQSCHLLGYDAARFGCVGGRGGVQFAILIFFVIDLEVIVVLTRKIVFCIATPCCLVSYRRFRET
jgi:hypothetical protein